MHEDRETKNRHIPETFTGPRFSVPRDGISGFRVLESRSKARRKKSVRSATNFRISGHSFIDTDNAASSRILSKPVTRKDVGCYNACHLVESPILERDVSSWTAASLRWVSIAEDSIDRVIDESCRRGKSQTARRVVRYRRKQARLICNRIYKTRQAIVGWPESYFNHANENERADLVLFYRLEPIRLIARAIAPNFLSPCSTSKLHVCERTLSAIRDVIIKLTVYPLPLAVSKFTVMACN